MQELERIAELRLKCLDFRALLEQRLAPNARKRALRVVGDRENAKPETLRRTDHLFERRHPVA